MSKCRGCGVLLQNSNKSDLGYVVDLNSKYCERCFRIKNYGEYKRVNKDNHEFVDILKDVGRTNDLVLLVVDVFNIDNNLSFVNKYLTNDILLVLTKRDLLPRDIKDEKLIGFFDRFHLNIKDSVIISSKKNYNFDLLYELINKYKRSNNVYVVGFTNAGKSTMINKLIYDFGINSDLVTVSIMPSTTLDKLEIKLSDDLTLIDTPGVLSSGSMYDKLDGLGIKRVIPKVQIKPKSYQVKGKQYIMVDKILKLDVSNVNIVMFFSNALDIKRYYKDFETSLERHDLDVDNCDIVINGLGFIKVIGKGKIVVYTLQNVLVYTREYLI